MNVPLRFGLQRTSLIDYAGKIAPVVFFPGCNLRCPYCQNPDLVYGRTEGLVPRDEVIEFLQFRAPLLGGVVLSGGEPLLYPGIRSFIARIKEETGLKVKLDTNGLHPGALRELNADYIAMDLKTLPTKYDRLGGDAKAAERLMESLDILKRSSVPFEIRTTIVPEFLPLEEVPQMARILEGVPQHFITGFKPGNCLDSAFNTRPEVGLSALEGYLREFRQSGCATHIRQL